MTKLIQRLPDSAREEVRNQAIVLIQQLTSTNEEMKTMMAFNDGFEILFRIINEEGGSSDAGLVVNDCLRICNNILNGSVTCQKLFFSMGIEWISRLANFFNPAVLESMELSTEVDGSKVALSWFDQSNRLSCAIFAQMILYNALNRGENRQKSLEHQNLLNDLPPVVIHSSAFWLARNGPMELLSLSLSFLGAIVSENPQIGHALSHLHIKIPPASKGNNIPAQCELPRLSFGWKPLPNDERRYISLMSLLAERYIYPAIPWNPDGGICFENGLNVEIEIEWKNGSSSSNYDKCCMSLFEKIISVDSAICDVMIQHALAPPSMLSGDDYDRDLTQRPHSQLEMMKPLVGLLTSNLILTCDKLSSNSTVGQYNTGAGALEGDIKNAERILHLLSMVYMHGSQLAKELSTKMTVGHIRSFLDAKFRSGNEMDVKPMLPMILATVGLAARLPGGNGYGLVSSILQWLAIVVTGCERATIQVAL